MVSPGPILQPPRDKWVVELLAQESPEPGIVTFEYAVREAGKDPFLLSNHYAQIRTNHQRIQRDGDGKRLHESGVAVANADMADFIENDSRYYRWVDEDGLGNWRDDRGRTLAPYLFNSAPWRGGVSEELDPQWLRETFLVDQQSQVNDYIRQFLDKAEANGWTGDLRGTTYNLQVGASGDDGWWSSIGPSIDMTAGLTYVGEFFQTLDSCYRFTGATGIFGETVTSADLSLWLEAEAGTPLTNIYADDQDDPSAPTTPGDFSGRSRTSQFTVQDGSGGTTGQFNAYDLNDATNGEVIQHIADNYDTGSILILHDDDGSGGTSNYLQLDTYDGDTSHAAKLDIITAVAGFAHSQAVVI